MTVEVEERWIEFNPFCKPWITNWANHVRLIWDGRDVTPEPDHSRNRWSCGEANRRNRDTANRFGLSRMPYYHYDALSGRAIEMEAGVR